MTDAPRGTCRIRGRCVDERGGPLAGVEAFLFGHSQPGEDERCERDHGPLAWRNQRELTGADGRFVVECTPPPPGYFGPFRLTLERAGRVSLGCEWAQLEPGTDVDLGDSVMTAGARLGLEVGPADAIERGSHLVLEAVAIRDSAAGVARPRGSVWMLGALAGKVVDGLAPGRWRASLPDLFPRIAPRELDLVAGENVVAWTLPPLPPMVGIAGTVVDELGRPVAGVLVRGDQYLYYPRAEATTDGAGRFAFGVPAADALDEPFVLEVHGDEGEPRRTERVHRWGEEDVRLVVRGRATVPFELRVRDGRACQPLEEYALRVIPAGAETECHGGWQHPGGVTSVTNLCAGSWLLVIEPRASSGLGALCFEWLELEAGKPRRIEVELLPAARRVVRVRDAAGNACAGSSVEVLQPPPGGTVGVATRGLDASVWHLVAPSHEDVALALARATTGDDGTAELVGPAARGLVVRVSGDAHPTVIVAGVVLSDARALEVEVPPSGTVCGRVVPAAVIEDLRAQSRAMRGNDGHPGGEGEPPVLLLSRTASGPGGDRQGGEAWEADIARDGTFEARGVPPGEWDLRVVSSFPSKSGWPTLVEAERTGLVVRAGEMVDVELDLSARRRALVRGGVTRDGVSFTGVLEWSGELAWPAGASLSFRTGAAEDGSFEALVPAGTWHVLLQDESELHEHGERVVEAALVLEPGATHEVAWDTRAAAARVRIADAGGRVVRGLQLSSWHAGRSVRLARGEGAEDGSFVVRGAPGTYELQARVRSLQRWTAYRSYRRAHEHSAEAEARAWVSVGRLVLGGEAPRETVELRLPAGWDR